MREIFCKNLHDEYQLFPAIGAIQAKAEFVKCNHPAGAIADPVLMYLGV
jgi:hypothetical protein